MIAAVGAIRRALRRPERGSLGVIAASLIAGLASTAADAAPAAAESGSAAIQLPAAFHVNAAEFVFVKASLNGAAPVWMLLDTSMSASAITPEYAKSLGLKFGAGEKPRAVLGGANFSTHPIVVGKVQAGSYVRKNVLFYTAPLPPTAGPDGKPVAGELGYSFLSAQTLVLDYPKSEAWIAPKGLDGCNCGVPFKLVMNAPAVHFQVGDHTLSAIVATGAAEELLLSPSSAAQAGLSDVLASSETMKVPQVGGMGQVKVTHSGPEFTVGDATRVHSFVVFEEPPPIYHVDGAIGAQFLKDYKVTFDYRSDRIRFEQ